MVAPWLLAFCQYSSQSRSRTASDEGSMVSAYPQYGHLSARCEGSKSSLAPQPGHGNFRPVADCPLESSAGAFGSGPPFAWATGISGGTEDTASSTCGNDVTRRTGYQNASAETKDQSDFDFARVARPSR
jgi:hypothetical protein